MSLTNIIIRQGKILFRHAQGAVSHAPLQGEHVAAAAEVLDGVLVPEVIGGESFQTGLLSIAAELYGPGVGIPLAAG